MSEFEFSIFVTEEVDRGRKQKKSLQEEKQDPSHGLHVNKFRLCNHKSTTKFNVKKCA